MLYALFSPIPAQTPWITWPDFAGQLQGMFESFIQPAIPWLCAIVIAMMLFRKLSNNPDQADIVAAVIATITISVIGAIIHQLPTIIASIVTAGVVVPPLRQRIHTARVVVSVTDPDAVASTRGADPRGGV